MDQDWMEAAAARAEARLSGAGIELTLGGEPTYVPVEPEGAEWSVAADGPTKLPMARAMARAIQRRTWPGSTLLYCSGKRYEGEVNPRWALRLVTGLDGKPIAPWPVPDGEGEPLAAAAAKDWLKRLGQGLGVSLHPRKLRDPLDPQRWVWAVPLTWDGQTWSSSRWELPREQRLLTLAPGPAGLRLPLEHFPAEIPCQLLTLEIDAEGWGLFLPPLERRPTEELLRAISDLARAHGGSGPLGPPEFSGLLPVDAAEGWDVLGLAADPGVLEINLPVCAGWSAYRHWIRLLHEAAAEVGLRSWKAGAGGGQDGTGGGNHLLWGGPSLERHPFFSRPAWLVGVLRYFQHHPSLGYLFSGSSVGPASQAPRPDEALGGLFDLELAYRFLEELGDGDQRQLIGETLRHLHADRSGNNHRSEISLDKFWNPGTPAGCLGLIEFRALETLPDPDWTAAIALLWSSLAAMLLSPERRPARLRDWGAALHDRMLLPSALWHDLELVLADLAEAGLPLAAEPFRAIWRWRFPPLLQWQGDDPGEHMSLLPAPEPWPLICDTPREGGFTSRFVDASLQRFEVQSSAAFQRRRRLLLNGRPLPLGEGPLAVRYRQHRLYPCLHPGVDPHLPLVLQLFGDEPPASGEAWLPLAQWSLETAEGDWQAQAPSRVTIATATAWRALEPGLCTVDLRLEPQPHS
ncbi:MAG: transglutaminase family protein [Prochlorococcaceae cyanobacterium]